MRGLSLLCVSVLTASVLTTLAQSSQSVRGTVLSKSSQQPVVNAEVIFEPAVGGRLMTTTDGAGAFTFASGQLGVVTVSHGAFLTAYLRWPPTVGSSLIIELEPAVTVSGTLADSETLQPLAGSVTVLVQHPVQTVSRTVDTKDDGTFEIKDVPAGSGTVFGAADGHAPTVRQFVAQAGAWWTEHLRLPSAVALPGQVLDVGGDPVKGALVAAEYIASTQGSGILTSLIGGRFVTDADGAFVLTGLRPQATINVQATYNGRPTAVVAVTVNPFDSDQKISLRLPAG